MTNTTATLPDTSPLTYLRQVERWAAHEVLLGDHALATVFLKFAQELDEGYHNSDTIPAVTHDKAAPQPSTGDATA